MVWREAVLCRSLSEGLIIARSLHSREACSPRPNRAIPPCVLRFEAFRFDLPGIARGGHQLERSMPATRSE